MGVDGRLGGRFDGVRGYRLLKFVKVITITNSVMNIGVRQFWGGLQVVLGAGSWVGYVD
jgi:hypothetical protein